MKAAKCQTSVMMFKRHHVPADRLLANDPQKVGLQRDEGSHLLLPVPRDVVGSHQPAEAVTEDSGQPPGTDWPLPVILAFTR
jgi:hypothetical protein